MATEPACRAVILDKEHALTMVADDEVLLRQVVAIFLEDCPGIIESLERAIAAGDAMAAKRAAHKLKGATRTLGGTRATAALTRLEDARPETGNSAWRRLYDELKAEIDAFTQALRTIAS